MLQFQPIRPSWTGSPTRSSLNSDETGIDDRHTPRLSPPRKPFAGGPLGGSVEERLTRLPNRGACAATTPSPSGSGCCSTRPSNRSGRQACSGCGSDGVRRSRRKVATCFRRRSRSARQFQCGAGSSVTLRILRAAAQQPCHSGRTQVVPPGQCRHHRRQRDHGCGRAGAVERGHQGASRHRGVLRLNGYKFYSTGTLFADIIAVSALDADGRDVQAIIPADRPGSNCSTTGTVRSAHHRQRRHPIHRRRGLPRRGHHGVRRARSDTGPHSCSCIWRRWRWASPTPYSTMRSTTYVRRPARRRIRSRHRGCRSFVLQAVGEISAAAASAEAIVLTAADAIDRLVDQGRQQRPGGARRRRRHGRRGTVGGRTVDDLGRGATLRHRGRIGHRPRAEPGPALAQCAHDRRAQPVGVQGIRGRQYAVNGTWPPANGYF